MCADGAKGSREDGSTEACDIDIDRARHPGTADNGTHKTVANPLSLTSWVGTSPQGAETDAASGAALVFLSYVSAAA